VTDSSVPAVIETLYVALRPYLLSLGSETQLTTPGEVQEAMGCLKVSKVPAPNGFPNRTWCVFAIEEFPSSPVISKRLSALITFPKRGSTLERSLSLNRGRIQHCPLPIGLLVS
jgi:hypothetical protein